MGSDGFPMGGWADAVIEIDAAVFNVLTELDEMLNSGQLEAGRP